MRDHHKLITDWDNHLYVKREGAHKTRVLQKRRHLKENPEMKNLINFASLRNQRIFYGNNITGNKLLLSIEHKFRNYRDLYCYGNLSYLAGFDLKGESNDAEACENEDLNALGNLEISQGLSCCVKEAGYSLELGTPHAKLPPSTSATLTHHLDSWFPTWQDGVCRIIGQTSSPSKRIITGAILSFSETNQTFTTLQCNYKFSENIDKKSLAKYMKIDSGLSFIVDDDNMYRTLQQDNWLKNIVKLSLQSEYVYFKFAGASINKFLSKDRKKHVSSVLFEKSAPKSPSNLVKSVKCSDYESICIELEKLLKIVQIDGEWLKPFQDILKKCGQNVDLVHNSKNTESFHDPFSFRENDLDQTCNSLSYEEFTTGNKFNSTFTNIEAQLVLWSIVKDVEGKFCITGLKFVDDKKKFYEIKPTPITTVIDNGGVVIADKCCYKLLGPLYALSIRLAYSDFLNSDYLWPFLPYFMTGLPTNWKIYISIIDILSKCSLLHYVSRNINAENLNEFNLSEKTIMNHSPSFNPSISILSTNHKDSSNNKENYRKSIKRNSTINSKILRENNTNNEENDVFKENDKAICKRLSDMTNVFCFLDQTENIYKNKKSILKKRTSVRNDGATSSLDAHSIFQKTPDAAVDENELPLNLKISRRCDIDCSICSQSKIENNKVNAECRVSNQLFGSKLNRSQLSQSKLKFSEQDIQKTPETNVKKRFESNERINYLRNYAIEDLQCSTQISRDLNSPLSVGRTSSNTVEIDQSQSQSICSRKRKSQQVLVETPSKTKRLNNIEETKVSQNKESFGNKKKKLEIVHNVEETKIIQNKESFGNKKRKLESVHNVEETKVSKNNASVGNKKNNLKSVHNVEETKVSKNKESFGNKKKKLESVHNVEETKVIQNKASAGNKKNNLKSVHNVEKTKMKYNKKSAVNTKPDVSSLSKVRFSLNSETPNQTMRKKRTSMNKSMKVQAEPIDSDGLESDLYFQADSFLINIKTTRSGRKSIPPIDPRSDIERFQEDGKTYVISKGHKFEL